MWADLKKSAMASELSILEHAIHLLWSLTHEKTFTKKQLKQSEKASNELDAIVPDDDSPKMDILGWSNLLNSAVYALNCVGVAGNQKFALAAADYAYQAVYERQIFPLLMRPMIEHEVTRLEAANPLCMAEIEYQITLLNRIASGDTIEQCLHTDSLK